MQLIYAALQVGGLAALIVAAFMVSTVLGLTAAGSAAFAVGVYLEHR